MRNERLVVLSGALKDKTFVLKGSLTVGRNPESGIHLDDLQVSRKHATIEQRPKGTFVKDLGSGNGTYIGDRRIIEYKLSDGDVIRIGMQELRFEGDKADSAKKEGTLDGSDGGVRFKSEVLGSVQAKSAENVFQTFFQQPATGASQEELRETQRRLQAVYTANQIITSERNLFKLFERVMDQIFTLIPAHNGVILLKEHGAEELVTASVKSGVEGKEVVISSSIVRRAYEKGEAVITYDAADDSRFEAGMSIISQNISSAMCVPLTHQSERLGVIYVDTR
ncbi:MAG: FHA domain-containing protein, partial [Candidatus Hydrogenedentes bacterium]|nr:FHA domain-containing protein [Candidatus Hydrogenedentota bacterium]